MRVVRVGSLPSSALEAATAFHATVLSEMLGPPPLGEDLVLIFPPAPFDHRGWRLAVVQDLARLAAPGRVNGVAGDDEEAIERTLAWLAQAPGITGQLLSVQTG